MRLLIDLAIAIVIAAALGFATAWYAVDRGFLFGAIDVGPWEAWPSAGSPDADPYSIARLARTGEVPLGAGEGLAFTATTDQSGATLVGTCTYRLDGLTPAARLWTLTAYDGNGRLMANAARRTGFHSREILRHQDGSFTIAVSTRVHPGNWLPVATDGAFSLVLRLYDTPLTTGGEASDTVMPEITREACR